MAVANNASSPVVPSTPIRVWSRGLSYRFSPRTPSSTTPSNCSPFSSRSFASTSSTSPFSLKLSPISPLRNKSTHSIADQADNWRARAQLNGIKVATENECSDKELQTQYESRHFSPITRRPFSTFNTPLSQHNRDTVQTLGSLTAPPEPRRRRFFNSSFVTPENSDRGSPVLPSPTLPQLQFFKNLQHVNKSSDILQLPNLNPSCSVCHKESTDSYRMLVLSPCSHIFCSSCFTGTLNIVGEKNMSCMECNSSIDSFHFVLGGYSPSSSELFLKMKTTFNKSTDHFDHFLPVKASTASIRQRENSDIAVLRIDNVPWDVTPPLLEKFIKLPLIGAHVLLDFKGKTLSHAFVQLTLEDARIALRSTQNAILGRGRRARAVTVTLSSHEELMAAHYPHWRGKFKNGAPSLDTLDNDQVNDALTHGLLSKDELVNLLNLITTPDSHFLKVTSLPFYSLISILSTFPSDVDSQIFWNVEARDLLYSITLVAIKAINTRSQEFIEDPELRRKLLIAAFKCEAFTDSQRAALGRSHD